MIERICIILAFDLIFYFKTLRFNYVSDDIPACQRPKTKNKWKHWLFVFEGRERHSPQADHLMTMLLHAAVCVLLYVAFGATDASFLAALLFCVNPTMNQGSVWIAGRHYVVPAIGILLTMIFPYLAPATFLGTTFYNHGFITPVVLLGSTHPWTAYFLPFCWAFRGRRIFGNVSIKAKKELFYEDRQIKKEKIVLAIKTFGYYTTLTLIPFRTSFYHAFLQSAAGSMKDRAYTMKDRFFWFGLAYLAGIGWYFSTQPWTATSLGLLWWCVGILPFLNIIRMHQEIGERYCYLPGVGLMVALASVLSTQPILASFFLASYGTKMWFYTNAYRDDFFLIENARLNSPDAWFAWHVAGHKRWGARSHHEALVFWTMAKQLSPKEFKVLFNLATCLALMGKKKEAEAFLALAEKNIPGGQEDQSNSLIAEWRTGKFAVLL